LPSTPAPPAPAPSGRGFPIALALLTLLVSLGATLVTWSIAWRQQEQRDQARILRFISRTEQSLNSRLSHFEDLARGTQGFLTGGPKAMTPTAWRNYVACLDLPHRDPNLVSLAFIEPVSSANLPRYIKEHPQVGGKLHGPNAVPLPLQDPSQEQDRLIISLCEPGERAAQGLGLDVGLVKTERLAAERARDTGKPSLSGPFTFTHPEGPQGALALFLPLYQGSPEDTETRQKALIGWVSAGILVQPLVEEILRGEDPSLAFEIVDAYSANGPQWVRTAPDWPSGKVPTTVRMLEVGGRGWELRYATKPDFYRSDGRHQPLFLLLGGVILSLALAGLVWALGGTRQRALDLAQAMNASLLEAQRRNRSHLTQTPLAVIETDDRFLIREWNQAAERIFGFSQDQVLGRDPRFLIPPEDQSEIPLQREALLQAEGGSRISSENVTCTGERIICDWYITALRDDQGRFMGASYLGDDVTERRRVEKALLQAQKLESLGVLAGGIAHDFNNLLTAILGNTELALDRADDDPALRVTLQRIEAATQRGSDLARQLLAYAGKGTFAVKPLDLNKIILELGDLLSVSLSKKVILQTDLAPDLPPVNTDAAQFQQIIMNLVINASEAMEDQPGTVILRTRSLTYTQADLASICPGQVLEPGPFVRLEVADNGCGMDPETIGRIFDPFFTTKFTGRGLGLSAMLGIVRGHRAGIRVESTPGEGTTFILLFPASAPAAAVPEPAGEPAPVTTGTVLVVDDEHMLRELARKGLEAAGYQVLEAVDGLDALAVFQAQKQAVDLVLMDMTMPRMGGAEAFRRLRGLDPALRVVLTSGYTQREAMESLADLPPDGFLQKPFRIRDLVDKIREVQQLPPRGLITK
jgi:PAS domain S-box-containing protein